jgi:hypothetical protein
MEEEMVDGTPRNALKAIVLKTPRKHSTYHMTQNARFKKKNWLAVTWSGVPFAGHHKSMQSMKTRHVECKELCCQNC